MKLPDDSPVLECFRIMGETSIPVELESGELPLHVSALETFVCSVYAPNGPETLPELRWELFRTRNLEGEMLPPTRASLLPHILRCNYISRRDKSYTSACPVLPPIEQNGWNLEEGVYTPVMCLSLPAPKAVIELVKCGCQKGGCTGNCSCNKNHVPCTPMCKCSADICDNASSNTNSVAKNTKPS